MKKGFLQIPNNVLLNDFWDGLKLCKKASMIDLYSMMRKTAGTKHHSNKCFYLEPFQIITSHRFLSIRWNRNKSTVSKWLKDFEKVGLISLSGSPNGTLITIINVVKSRKGTQNGPLNTDEKAVKSRTPSRAPSRTVSQAVSRTNSNIVNNNEKIGGIENTPNNSDVIKFYQYYTQTKTTVPDFEVPTIITLLEIMKYEDWIPYIDTMRKKGIFKSLKFFAQDYPQFAPTKQNNSMSSKITLYCEYCGYNKEFTEKEKISGAFCPKDDGQMIYKSEYELKLRT